MERERLVNILIAYKKIKGHDITVVFDGWKSGGQREEFQGIGGIKIIYSRLGEKADLVIKRTISRDKDEWIVVSSDRDIMGHAWASGSVPVSSDRFLSIIENTERISAGEYDLIEEESEGSQGKGRSRTLSKKEKSLVRTLRKL